VLSLLLPAGVLQQLLRQLPVSLLLLLLLSLLQ
jgi:hypothetical protein